MNITVDQLKTYSGQFTGDPLNAIRKNAVVKSGVAAAAENQRADIDNPMIFSVEVESGAITNQKHSGRCWLFACLNTLRFEIIKKLNLETFELSQNYQMFWDKMEKANYFADSILKTLDEPTDGRLVQHLLANPVQDGGQWDMVCALIDKYGVVPKCVMPETFSSSDTGKMVELLTLRLRQFAKEVRAAYAAGTPAAELEKYRGGLLSDVYRMLCICLGEPPKIFTFEYRDKDKKFFREEGLTPRAFYEKYIGLNLDDYLSVINAPTADKPYNRTFTVAFLGNVSGGRKVKYLNLPSDELKKLAIAQLKDGKPVWFGCDVGKYLVRDRGIMALNGYDYEGTLGVPFPLTKAERLDYASSQMTHAMVFLGVNLDAEGKPTRWKVENSWGDESGQKGYYLMSDEWFDQYNYQVVVDRKYMTDEQRAAFALEPIELKPWDPMGSLA